MDTTTDRLTPEEIRALLAQCYGSAEFYRHWSGLIYTEGIQTMAEACRAYWLIDLIASHQGPIIRHPGLADFQLWEITARPDHTATVTCRADSDRPAVVQQELEYTDFPLDTLTIYVEGVTILLPSEH